MSKRKTLTRRRMLKIDAVGASEILFPRNAATIFWSQGLSTPPGHTLPWSHWSRPHGPDERVQQITRNLLDRAIEHTNRQ